MLVAAKKEYLNKSGSDDVFRYTLGLCGVLFFCVCPYDVKQNSAHPSQCIECGSFN